MYKTKNKENKIAIYKQIQNNYNYFIFCDYKDLNLKQLIAYKIYLKNENIKFKCIKNTLNLIQMKTIKNKGTTLMIFFNDFKQLQKILLFLENKEFQFKHLTHKNKIYTNFKINNILKNKIITDQLLLPLFMFYLTILQLN